ncbi:alpha-N-acetylgalactosaminide alpha-2,6-sialyltransferase 6 isoform X2 [Ambystoma mexicanum]|uniref:alpha-N-acetylgalactosaminide alpha-2,6-sialyltransferase 6 isoform X2 n=1 Tax=Ambystoma mexicanum TaxID=8296 RepID=UPI0037E74BE9
MSRKKDLIGKKDLSGKKDLIGKKDPTGATGQQTAIFLLLFTLITLLILYSSNTSRESFQFSALKVKHRQPPNFKRVDIRSGYLPVRGNKTLHLHCQRCVVITSSSHLIGSHLGATIDDSECTVRMNDAPTTGYEKDVGSKTTFRVVAHSSVYRVLRRPQEFLNKTQETTLIFWGPPNKLQEGSKGGLLRVIQHTTGPFPNVAAYVVSPGKMKTFDDLFRGETGKDSRRAAVHKLAYHYYEPKGPDECTTYIQNERSRRGSHHRFITEKLVFAHWASLYNITFSHPRWFQDQ